jgi:hypothetical protein
MLFLYEMMQNNIIASKSLVVNEVTFVILGLPLLNKNGQTKMKRINEILAYYICPIIFVWPFLSGVAFSGMKIQNKNESHMGNVWVKINCYTS